MTSGEYQSLSALAYKNKNVACVAATAPTIAADGRRCDGVSVLGFLFRSIFNLPPTKRWDEWKRHKDECQIWNELDTTDTSFTFVDVVRRVCGGEW